MTKGLAPIFDEYSEVLILGSLPSVKSINKQQYYGNSTNHFWRILGTIYKSDITRFKEYEDKVEFLKENHIALWDVVESATRKGSLDTNIKEVKYNNIKDFINNISFKKILVNGKKAEELLLNYMRKENIEIKYTYLPSSSSANTKYTIEEKTKIWKNKIIGEDDELQ